MTKINKFKTFVTVLLLCIVALGSAGCFGHGSDDDSTPKYEISADGKYMYFGSYPQTLKAENVTITDAVRDTNGYYTGSDGEKYAKLTAVNASEELGVSNDQWIDWDMNKSLDDRVMILGTEYYFKVEPIKWRVLTNTNGTYLLVCDSILSGLAYQPNYTKRGSYCYATDARDNIITDNGSQVYANNYKHSQLRSWLNGTFYDTAFTSGEQSLIQTTEVDNTLASTGQSSNSYICDNTNDKVFALSYADVTSIFYGFDSDYSVADMDRYWATTDYARATGAMTITPDFARSVGDGSYDYNSVIGSGGVWLRSPNPTGSYRAYAVYIGLVDFFSPNSVYYGVAPALQISL